MARARNIKPSFFQNEEIGDLQPLERLAFIGMWTISDYKGCIELRPKRLKVQILPYDQCDFDLIVNNLEHSGFISTYSVSGKRYIKIINFEKHQNPHKNERETGSEIPDILDRDDLINEINKMKNIENNRDKNGTDRADSPFPLPDSFLLISDSLVLIPDSCTEQKLDAEIRQKKNNSMKNELPAAIIPSQDEGNAIATAQEADSVVIELPLIDKTMFSITKKHFENWVFLYQAVDVFQELKNMRGWLDANPSRRKTKNGILKFVNGWLAKEQDNPKIKRDQKNAGFNKQPTQRPDYSKPVRNGDAIDSTCKVST